MNIQILKQKTEEMRLFDQQEWKRYDEKHFGKTVVWDTDFYYLNATDNKGICGTMELKVEGGVGKIHTLLVRKNTQRQGIGTALIQAAEEITRKQKGHKLFLLTGKNWEAVLFYKAMGFEPTGEVNNHYFHSDFIELSKFI